MSRKFVTFFQFINRYFKLKSPSGEIHSFLHITEFCRKYNLTPSMINRLLHRKFKSTKGWTIP